MEIHAYDSTTPLGTDGHCQGDPRTRVNAQDVFSSRVRIRHFPGADEMRLTNNKRFNIRIATWNVGTMTSKSLELERALLKRRIDVLCVQETRWKNMQKKSRFLNSRSKNYKMFYYGTSQGQNGVGVIINRKYLRNIIEIRYVSDRIILVKLVIAKTIWNIISAYAPQVGLDQQTKDTFWDELGKTMESIPLSETKIIGADLNGHVGKCNNNYESCHGNFGFGARNTEGETILDFATQFHMTIMNTFFQKADRHLVTYKSGERETQIDYLMCQNDLRRSVKDCKVVLGESFVSQHRLLIAELCIVGRSLSKDTSKVVEKIKWHNLKNEQKDQFVKEMREWLADLVEFSFDLTAEEMWNNLEEVCVSKARDQLGVSKGRLKNGKESWWWNEKVASAIQRKKLSFREYQCYKGDDEVVREQLYQAYKTAKKDSKAAVAEAQNEATSSLYDELQTPDGAKNIFKIAAQRRYQSKDIVAPKYINDSDDKLITDDVKIVERWQEYYKKLLNEEYPASRVHLETPVDVVIDPLSNEEVLEAVSRMKKGKSAGPDDIPVEFWLECGPEGVEFLRTLFDKILHGQPMPSSFRYSILVPFYKNKGDSRRCENYRGIKLISHTMKIYERIIDTRLRSIVLLHDNQCGFVKGRSTTEAIQSIRILTEKYQSMRKDLHMIFIDLEKAFDRVPRSLIWHALRAHNVPETYVSSIKDMYTEVHTRVRSTAGTSNDFRVDVGVHQGSVLSPLLFNIVMNYITSERMNDVLLTLLFADDIVLVSEDPQTLQTALDNWKSDLEQNGLRISRSKTEYLFLPFSDPEAPIPDIYLDADLLPKCEKFKYLGSAISNKGTCHEDVIARIQTGWMKWHQLTGVLCDKKMPLRLKGMIHKTVMRPAMLYGSQCWTMYSEFNRKLETAEMKMLRISRGVSKLDKISSDKIRQSMGIQEPIYEKLEEYQLKWYGHVKRREQDDNYVVTQATKINSTYVPPPQRGRKKNSWQKQMETKLHNYNIREDVVNDRGRYRLRVHTRSNQSQPQ